MPSIAFIDEHTRWNLVVFFGKVPLNTSEWVVSVESAGWWLWNET